MTSQQAARTGFSRREFLRMVGLVGFGTAGFGATEHWSVTAQALQSPIAQTIASQIKALVDDFGKKKSAVGLAVGVVYPDKTKKTGSTLKLTPTLSTPRAATSTATTQTYFWGETQQGNGQLPDAQTVFGIGSVGKVFTATLLADMVFNQKLLALNDLVQPYYDKLAPGVVTLPTFKGQGIRFVHLATHTAGLPDQPKEIRSDACGTPMTAVYDFLKNFKLPQAPGEQAAYSDMGFDLLSDILNRISGAASRDQALTELLNRAKLTMPDTGAITLDLQKNPHYATGYDVNAKGAMTSAALITCDSGSDHVGQVASTLADMLVWAQFNLGLTDSPFNNLLPELQKPRHQMGAPDDQVGLGWQMHALSKGSKPTVFAKDGSSILGYSADMLYIPSLGVASVTIANANAIEVPNLNASVLAVLAQS